MSLQHSETAHETVASLSASSASDGSAPIVLDAAGGNAALIIPGGTFLLHAEFGRQADDLVLSGVDGQPDVVVRGFFDAATLPALETEGGARIDGALAARLAGSPSPAQYAAADDPAVTGYSDPIAYTVTDEQGRFQFERPAGVYRLEFYSDTVAFRPGRLDVETPRQDMEILAEGL